MTPEERAKELCDEARNWWGPRRSPARIAEAIRAAIAEEREACARHLQEVAARSGCNGVYDTLAASIRART